MMKFIQQWIAISMGGRRDGSRTMFFSTAQDTALQSKYVFLLQCLEKAGIRNALQLYNLALSFGQIVEANMKARRPCPSFLEFVSEQFRIPMPGFPSE